MTPSPTTKFFERWKNHSEMIMVKFMQYIKTYQLIIIFLLIIWSLSRRKWKFNWKKIEEPFNINQFHSKVRKQYWEPWPCNKTFFSLLHIEIDKHKICPGAISPYRKSFIVQGPEANAVKLLLWLILAI